MTAPCPVVDARAPCTHGDPDRFFDSAREEQVKEECKPCPFCGACLRYALDWAVSGVWGSTTEADRQKLRQLSGQVPEPLTSNAVEHGLSNALKAEAFRRRMAEYVRQGRAS